MEPSSFASQWCRLLHCEMWCVPSGAVCYTEACLDIVVLLVTLWFHFSVACRIVFIYCAQWCRLLHWGLFGHSGAACYTMFPLHIDYGSLQRIVYTVVPFVTLWVYGICPVVPFVALGLVMFAQWCCLLHWGLWCLSSGAVCCTGACEPFVANRSFLYIYMQQCMVPFVTYMTCMRWADMWWTVRF